MDNAVTPCPQCCQTDRNLVFLHVAGEPGIGKYWVECHTCGLASAVDENPHLVMMQWRDAHEAQIARLKTQRVHLVTNT